MKTKCNDEIVTITEKDIQNRFKEMQEAYAKSLIGIWSDYGDCNRAIDKEIKRRVLQNQPEVKH